MKLRLRQSAGHANGSTSKLPSDGKVVRQSPPGVVTSWIRQGLSLGMCPLCRVVHKADRQYIWHFYDERSNDMDAVEEVRRAFGFCADHIEMLRRIDVEGMKTTLSISVLFADTFAGIAEQLESLTNASAFEPEECPACASRDEYVRRNVQYLLDMLATHDDKFRHEPKGPERDSWQRAIFLSSGWPPPSGSAAEPEQERR